MAGIINTIKAQNMDTLYFLDFLDPILFQGKGKFVASSKARNDVTKIVRDYWQCEYLPIIRTKQSKFYGVLLLLYKTWRQLHHVPKGSTVFFQYPIFNNQAFKIIAPLFKKFHSIALVHDLPSYRHHKRPIKEEIAILNCFHTVIVHSQNMKERLLKDGLKSRMVILEVFDYLLNEKQTIHRQDNTIVFAGGLSKSLFLKDLSFLPFKNIHFNIYGKGLMDGVNAKNMTYKGTFLPDDITDIEGEWGLLWEGISIESCQGSLGKYLTLIAPHKLSLYIACGLKIIAWESSAMASFIIKNKIGITIDKLENLEETINNISQDEIEKMEKNVKKVAHKIREGAFLKEALSKAISI